MRTVSRIEGVSTNTVTKLMVEAGEACAAYHDEAVRDVQVRKVQCNEIWTFCYTKQRNVARRRPRPVALATCGPGRSSMATAR